MEHLSWDAQLGKREGFSGSPSGSLREGQEAFGEIAGKAVICKHDVGVLLRSDWKSADRRPTLSSGTGKRTLVIYVC